jgi:sulfate transport system ATP-binding protein
VARFLGTANLFVGESATDEVRLGPVRFPPVDGRPPDPRSERVQVLFRPEDVSIKASLDELEWPALGEAVVEETGFLGSFQRLRLRLARLAGVRPIAPAAPFGGDSFIVEAVRSQHEARRFPLATGDRAFVGVRRIHALTHPGLSFLLLGDGPEETRVAIEFGGQIARLAHARVTLLVRGVEDRRLREEVERAHERIGSGLMGLEAKTTPMDITAAISRQIDVEQHDLVVTGVPARGRVEIVESLLRAGIHNLLLVPRSGASVPKRVLVCVAVGEPGKEDVQFTARLIRHFRADATVVSVVPMDHTPDDAAQARRFLAACVRSMSLLGVRASPQVRIGSPQAQILQELTSGKPELLVLGAPLPNRRGQIILGPLVSDLVESMECPVLLVRPRLG